MTPTRRERSFLDKARSCFERLSSIFGQISLVTLQVVHEVHLLVTSAEAFDLIIDLHIFNDSLAHYLTKNPVYFCIHFVDRCCYARY